MSTRFHTIGGRAGPLALGVILAAILVGCATEPSSAAPSASESAAPSAEPSNGGNEPAIAFTAASTTVTVDGDASDWSAIEGATLTLEQIRLENLDPSVAAEIDFDPVDPVEVTFKVATDGELIYVLLEVPGDFVYDPADHNLSASVAVQFRIEEPAGAHMGSGEPDIDSSLGMVDMWHWELDCAPGVMSGGAGVAGGDDATCNLDDEFATSPESREDDGGGDTSNDAAENSLAGVWDHTGRVSGAGASGSWIFEFSRPLQTADPQDGQFASGDTAYVALAFMDPTEGATGWTDAGHLQSAYNGWIEVTLP